MRLVSAYCDECHREEETERPLPPGSHLNLPIPLVWPPLADIWEQSQDSGMIPVLQKKLKNLVAKQEIGTPVVNSEVRAKH